MLSPQKLGGVHGYSQGHKKEIHPWREHFSNVQESIEFLQLSKSCTNYFYSILMN